MSVVTKTVNFIRSKGLRHREFQDPLHSMDADFDDIPYQGCGVGSPAIRLRLLAISIIQLRLRLRASAVLVT